MKYKSVSLPTGVGVGAGDEEGIGMDEEAGVGEGVGVGIAVGVGRGRDPTLHPLVLQHCVTQDWILLPLLSLREAHAKSQNISGKHPLVKMTSLVLESNASWVKQTLSTGHSIISCIAVHIVSLEPWQLEQFSCIAVKVNKVRFGKKKKKKVWCWGKALIKMLVLSSLTLSQKSVYL